MSALSFDGGTSNPEPIISRLAKVMRYANDKQTTGGSQPAKCVAEYGAKDTRGTRCK